MLEQLPDMKVVFNAPLATEVYTNFCDMIVATEFETLLRDLYLKRRLEMSTPMLGIHAKHPFSLPSNFYEGNELCLKCECNGMFVFLFQMYPVRRRKVQRNVSSRIATALGVVALATG